ncbi:MAG: PEP-CTERM sorting domain-containing protein [Verrucomicrobia bacterium]|nr:PEP-CTERM sorting domain-containing protein [Verrucomicrobiota bacterium]
MKIIKYIFGIILLSSTSAFGQMYIIDFDSSPAGNISAGDEVTNQYSAWGVNFEYVQSSTSRPGLKLWAFDSGANQNGIDDDLETPGDGTVGSGNTASDWANNNYIFGNTQGADNVLIIQEQNNNTTPDDDSRGGIMNIIFDTAVTFNDIGILDIDDLGGDRPNSFIRFFDDLDVQIGTGYLIAELGNNSYQEVHFETFEVRRAEIEFGGSGAITGLKFTAQVPEPSTYGVIGAFFLSGLIYFRRRKLR